MLKWLNKTRDLFFGVIKLKPARFRWKEAKKRYRRDKRA